MAASAPDAKTLRDLPDADLEEQLKKLRDERWQLQVKAGTGALQQTHLVGSARRQMARLRTIIRERQQRNTPQQKAQS